MVLLVGCKEVPVLWTEKTSSRRSSCGFERHGPGGLPAPERHDRERKRRKELPSGDEEQHRPGAPVLKQRPDDNEADRSGEERHRQDARHDLGAKSLGRAHREHPDQRRVHERPEDGAHEQHQHDRACGNGQPEQRDRNREADEGDCAQADRLELRHELQRKDASDDRPGAECSEEEPCDRRAPVELIEREHR